MSGKETMVRVRTDVLNPFDDIARQRRMSRVALLREVMTRYINSPEGRRYRDEYIISLEQEIADKREQLERARMQKAGV